MRTRSQSRNLHHQQQQAPPPVVEPFNLEEPIENPAPPLVPMADNRTMAQLLQAPTEGYEDAIVIPEINANFELKHGLINLVQNKQFFGHDKEDPHAHIRYFNKITSTMRFPDIPSTLIGMDISKIIRKQSKTGKHEHGKRKSTKKSQRCKAKARKSQKVKAVVNLKSKKVNLGSNKNTLNEVLGFSNVISEWQSHSLQYPNISTSSRLLPPFGEVIFSFLGRKPTLFLAIEDDPTTPES
ncbi:hypothetical protein Tco_1391167 [Tanacetum coccineum]